MPQHQNESEAIRNLQRYLRQLSYHEPLILAPPIDGIFESDTRRSLQNFQSLYGLPETGVADRETWDVLYAAYRTSITENTPPRAISVFPFLSPEDTRLTLGSNAFSVTVLQHMLRELSVLYSPLLKVEITGIYDDPTYAAVKLFQEKNRLPSNGTTDVSTWNAIADQYNLLFAAEPYL